MKKNMNKLYDDELLNSYYSARKQYFISLEKMYNNKITLLKLCDLMLDNKNISETLKQEIFVLKAGFNL
jgi:hypothetical protein